MAEGRKDSVHRDFEKTLALAIPEAVAEDDRRTEKEKISENVVAIGVVGLVIILVLFAVAMASYDNLNKVIAEKEELQTKLDKYEARIKDRIFEIEMNLRFNGFCQPVPEGGYWVRGAGEEIVYVCRDTGELLSRDKSGAEWIYMFDSGGKLKKFRCVYDDLPADKPEPK